MARRQQLESTPRGEYAGKKMSDAQKQSVVELYLLHGNKREVARQMGVCEKTVHVILNAIPAPEMDKRKAEKCDEMAARLTVKTLEGIETLTTDKYERASAPQTSLSIGINVDKIKGLQEHARVLRDTTAGNAGLLTPGSIEQLKNIIASKAKSLKIIGIEINTIAPELSEKLEDLAAQAEMGGAKDITDEVEVKTQKPEETFDFYETDGGDTPRSS